MKVLLISPLGFSVTPDLKYGGIERLVWEFSRELIRQGHNVTVQGPDRSQYPEGVNLLASPVGGILPQELTAYQRHNSVYGNFEVIHDFSHQHFASILSYHKNLPIVSAFWHSPELAKYPKAPYNIVAPTKWAASEFRRVYRQECKVKEIIIVDPEKFKPGGARGERFYCQGIMQPNKGNLNAVRLCKEMGLPLDVAGARGMGVADAPLSEYEKQIMELCDGKQIVFHGEVTDAQKIHFMQTCKALLYITDHPEPTNHKLQEAMACGASVIAPGIGAQAEIVTHGVNGYLCKTIEECKEAIKKLDKLNPMSLHAQLVNKYSPQTVVSDYVKLYEQVAHGARW